MALHLASLWNRGLWQLQNGLLDNNPGGGAGYGEDGRAVNLLSSKPVAVNNWFTILYDLIVHLIKSNQ